MFKKSFLFSSSILLALSVSIPAVAQEVEDEVIVTALKRETTLQETPVAVSVTSSDVIEKAQILDIRDLQSVVPSLRIDQLQTSINTNFTIRGFGNGANNAGIEPSVGVFIDGVYRSRSAAQIGDLPKLERVEVLKGPQSTLFGKNASAGVISVVTAKPSYESEGYVEVGFGNYDQKLYRGYFTGGLSDSLAVSVGASLNKRDGYMEPALDGLSDVGNRDRFSIRGQALLEPTDNISLRLIADYSRIDEICCGVTNLNNTGAAGAITALGGTFADANNPYAYVSYTNKDPINEVDDYGISFHADVNMDNMTVTSITAFRDNQNSYDQDADFNTLALLDSVNQEQKIKTFTQELRLASDWDKNFDWMVGGYLFVEDIDQVGGLEYGRHLQPYISTLLQLGTTIPNLLGTLESLYGHEQGAFLGEGTTTREAFTQYNTAWSVFGTVDFSLSDKLTATFGMNYTDDEKKITSDVVNGDIFSGIDLGAQNTVLGVPLSSVFFGQFFQASTELPATPANIAAVEAAAPGTIAAIQGQVGAVIAGIQGTQFQPPFLNFPNSVEDGKSNDNDLTYIARLSYEVNDTFNVYGSYGTGFKATSWNLGRDSRPFASDSAALTAANLVPANVTYRTRYAGPEKSKVAEIGLKAKFDSGFLNLAVFDQTIEDFQANPFLGTGFTLLNAGEQKTRGIEADGSYNIGGLTVSAAGTLLDAKYEEFTEAQGASVFQFNSTSGTYTRVPTDLSNTTVGGVPELSVSLGALYNHDFANGMSGYVRGDWQYETADQADDRFPEGTLPNNDNEKFTLSTFNASMGLDLNNGLALQVWGRNLFNDEYISTLFPGVAQDGIINGYPSQPRTYGVALRYTFD